MLASPGPQDLPDAKRDPTDQPKAGRDYGKKQVKGMVQLRPDEELLMPAPGAMGA
jgi:hypothetical protein